MKKIKNFLRGLIFLVIVFSLTKVAMANLITTHGMEMDQLEKQTRAVIQENKSLSEEIAQLSSLKRISDKAKKLGFINTSSLASFTQEEPIALR